MVILYLPLLPFLALAHRRFGGPITYRVPRSVFAEKILKNPKYRRQIYYPKGGKVDFEAEVYGKVYRVYNKR